MGEMSFLANYKAYVQNSECSSKYHLFCALTCISSLLGRRTWVDMGYYKIYPNMYIVLDGPPGNRKSSAMDMAYYLLKDVGGMHFASPCESAQALMIELAEAKEEFFVNGNVYYHSPLTVFATELCDFLSISSKIMIDFLTAIYDRGEYEYKTKNKGSCSIQGPSLNILACSTPARVTSYLKDDVISGGFSRRALFIYADALEKVVPRPQLTAEIIRAREQLLAHARQIQSLSGEVKWETEAQKYFDDWYISHWSKLPRSSVLGYWETKHVLLIKLAVLVAVSEESCLIIRKKYLEMAQDFLGIIEEDLGNVFAGIGHNRLNAASHEILRIVKIAGDILLESELRDIMFRQVDNKEYDEVLKFLDLTHKIKRGIHAGRIYVGTPKKVNEFCKTAELPIQPQVQQQNAPGENQVGSGELGGTEVHSDTPKPNEGEPPKNDGPKDS